MNTIAINVVRHLSTQPTTGQRIIDAVRTVGVFAGAITTVMTAALTTKKAYEEFVANDEEAA